MRLAGRNRRATECPAQGEPALSGCLLFPRRRRRVPDPSTLSPKARPRASTGPHRRTAPEAQEESLFRRTTLLRSLYQFADYPAQYEVAPCPHGVERDGQRWLTEPMAAATRLKVRAVPRIAARHDHSDLVLSAVGCGAFRNPPQHVARLFRETLTEEEFGGVFRRILFAIFDDHNAYGSHNPEGNYEPFARELGDPTPSAER